MDEPLDCWAAIDLDDERILRGLERLAARRRRELDAGARHVGWKVGWNDATIRQLLGLRSGAVGYLTDSTHASDGRVLMTTGTYAAEAEVAFTLASAVSSADSDERALGAIGHLQPAIEIVALHQLDVVDALERDIWHHAYALGPASPWSPTAIAELTVRLRHNGTDIAVPPPRDDKLADVASMLRFAAGGAEALGESLAAGDLILSGSLAPEVVWLSAGDRIDVHMPRLGDVSVTFVERAR